VLIFQDQEINSKGSGCTSSYMIQLLLVVCIMSIRDDFRVVRCVCISRKVNTKERVDSATPLPPLLSIQKTKTTIADDVHGYDPRMSLMCS
jgi:hypothetical protein